MLSCITCKSFTIQALRQANCHFEVPCCDHSRALDCAHCYCRGDSHSEYRSTCIDINQETHAYIYIHVHIHVHIHIHIHIHIQIHIHIHIHRHIHIHIHMHILTHMYIISPTAGHG